MPSIDLGAKFMKRSISESSMGSWDAVSEVSWVDIESKASECGWEDVLAEQDVSLEASMPMSISKADINELKAMAKPPVGVRTTMEVICIFLQEKPATTKAGVVDYWGTAKSVLADPRFMQRLTSLKAYVPRNVLDAVAPYMNSEDFKPDKMKMVSVAAESLCRFSQELFKYHTMHHASFVAGQEQNNLKTSSELLASCQDSLDGLSKELVSELKALGAPPQEVKDLLSCFIHLLAGIDQRIELTNKGCVKDSSWKAVQALLSPPDRFLEQLQSLPVAINQGLLHRRNMNKVRAIQINMGRCFSAESMRAKSSAAATLCQWITNILAYYEVAAPSQEGKPTSMAIHRAAATASTTSGLSRHDLQELKALSKPPEGVEQVVQIAALLLGAEDVPDWKGCQSLLSNPGRTLQKLEAFELAEVPTSTLAQAREKAERLDLSRDAVMAKSKAAGGLLDWLLNILEK